MYVNIEIEIKDVGILYPKGFYYKGEGTKTKLVVIGCTKQNHYNKRIFPLTDCELTFIKKNSVGDEFRL